MGNSSPTHSCVDCWRFIGNPCRWKAYLKQQCTQWELKAHVYNNAILLIISRCIHAQYTMGTKSACIQCDIYMRTNKYTMFKRRCSKNSYKESSPDYFRPGFLNKNGIICRMQQCSTMTKRHQSEVAGGIQDSVHWLLST